MDDEVIIKLEKFFQNFEDKAYKKGEIIIHAHDPASYIYFVKSGYVRQYFISSEGDDISLQTFRPGSFFPIALVLSGKQNKYFFEASNDVRVKKAPAERVIKFIKTNPDILFDLTKRLSAGLMGYLEKTENIILLGAYNKLISLLLYLVKHFGKEDDEKTVIDLPLTHKEIATWIGTSRETVSREMQKLKNKNIIGVKEKLLIIRDIDQLEKEGLVFRQRKSVLGISR